MVISSRSFNKISFLRATAYMLYRVYAIVRPSVRHTGVSYKNGWR